MSVIQNATAAQAASSSVSLNLSGVASGSRLLVALSTSGPVPSGMPNGPQAWTVVDDGSSWVRAWVSDPVSAGSQTISITKGNNVRYAAFAIEIPAEYVLEDIEYAGNTTGVSSIVIPDFDAPSAASRARIAVASGLGYTTVPTNFLIDNGFDDTYLGSVWNTAVHSSSATFLVVAERETSGSGTIGTTTTASWSWSGGDQNVTAWLISLRGDAAPPEEVQASGLMLGSDGASWVKHPRWFLTPEGVWE